MGDDGVTDIFGLMLGGTGAALPIVPILQISAPSRMFVYRARRDMSERSYIEIYPSESIYFDVDLSDALPAGANSIASATAAVKKVLALGTIGASYDALLESTVCAIEDNKARLKIIGANASERYRVEIAATTDDLQVFKSRLYFKCASV